MDQFGLHIKLYFINCHKHPLYEDEDYFADNPEYGEEVQVVGYSYKYMAYSSHTGNTIDIYQELEHTKCIGYSCIVALLNTDCGCRTKMLRKVLNAMKSNPNLRYKSKLIMATYTKKAKYQHIWERDMSDVFFQKYFENLKKRSVAFCSSTILHPDLNRSYANDRRNPFKKLQKIMQSKRFGEESASTKYNADHIKNITKNDINPLEDHRVFNEIKLDNAIFMQCFINNASDRGIEISTLMFQVFRSPMRPMQQVLLKNRRILGNFRIIQTSTNVDFYFFSINPALAIIINNYYFTESNTIRLGSEQNVRRLIRELKISGIPYILMQDCCRCQVLQIIESIERIDCSSLKSLLFFMMSHGGTDDIIHTHDGKLNVKTDIVSRIQSNRSLKKDMALDDTETLVLFNACRGTIDPYYADYDALDAITTTDNGYLERNTVVMYSIPNTVMSPRCAIHGSAYLNSFCQHIRNNKDLLKIDANVDNDLKRVPDYWGLDKRSELVSRTDLKKDHYITKESVEPTTVIQFIETILNDFPNLNGHQQHEEVDDRSSKPLFYISGSLGEYCDNEVSFADLYFAPELDTDLCSLDYESPLERCIEECSKRK